MKIINNSIDSAYLDGCISEVDLENQMANCEVKPEMMNGHTTDRLKSLDGGNIVLSKSTLRNGVTKNSLQSPTKCNGKVNGFYEEEEDFNLVLEDSSEGGESPSKKIDDDSLSAPQIVQEIEDLLGINSNSDIIQEELNNLDGAESIDDNLDHVEAFEDNSQEIEETFKDVADSEKNDLSKADARGEIQNNEEITATSDSTKKIKECDMSSTVDLMLDEAEVQVEHSNKPGQSTLIMESGNIECKDENTTKVLAEKVEESKPQETKDINTLENKEPAISNNITSVANTNQGDELPLTQSSGFSGASDDWMVLDSVGISDDENQDTEVSKSEDMPPQRVINLEGPSESVPPLEGSNASAEKEFLHDGDGSQASKDNPKVELVSETKDKSEIVPSTAIPSQECDNARKRSASENEENVELKKPKIEKLSHLTETTTSPVLKRPSPSITENESKRTKLQESSGCDSLTSENEQENGNSLNNASTEDLEKRQQTDSGMEKVVEEHIEESPTLNNSISTDSICSNVSSKTEDKVLSETIVEKPNENDVHMLKHDSICSNESSKTEDKVLNETIFEKPNERDVHMLKHDGKCSNVSSNIEDEVLPETIVEQPNKNDVPEEKTNEGLPTVMESTDVVESTVMEKKSRDTRDKEETAFLVLDSDSEIPNLVIEEKSVRDENKENFSGEPRKETGLSLDELSCLSKTNSTNLGIEKKDSSSILCTNFETKKDECSDLKCASNEMSCSSKKIEEKNTFHSDAKEKSQYEHERVQGFYTTLKKPGPKKMSNLEMSIERAVEKTRILTEKKVPILKKFHKDQLKKLKRSELEEIVVSKICEAVSYKSEIGQMRLRTQNLEETNEMWRKKVQQIEKQNRELEMVLKRFLNEVAHIKRENQNRTPVPLKVTRSVGLQVVLASSMQGALVSSRTKQTIESTQSHEQNSAKSKQMEKENVKESTKSSTFMTPAHSSSRGKAKPTKTPQSTQSSRPPTPQTYSTKVTPPTTPIKPAISTPNRDLEVIDLTDKEERAKAAQSSATQTPVGGQIRVSPSTQVCFVQQTPTTSPSQQPLYLVKNPGQRGPQFLVATSTPSPQRPVNSLSRPPPALALPVFRASGHLIPMQTSTSTQVSVKPSPPAPPPAPAPVVRAPPALRMQPQNIAKHPAPLPPTPMSVAKNGMKAPPPKPQLKIAKTANGIMLSWSMTLTKDTADMQSYQLYAYQEGNQPPSTGLWKKVGDVKALPLPMACTLTQFIEGHKYHFAVRAVDVYGRIGPFSSPSSIKLLNK